MKTLHKVRKIPTTKVIAIVNKAIITTLPGGNAVRSVYSGATVTATDQVNRKIKRETDGLGRLIKVTEQKDASGALIHMLVVARSFRR